jgi:hypothetical protein
MSLNESLVSLAVIGWLLALWLIIRLARPHMFGPVLWNWTAWGLVILLGLQGWSVWHKANQRTHGGQAFFVRDNVSVTTSPGGGTARLEVNAGTEARVVRRLGDHVQVRLPNELVGFVPADSLELLWPKQSSRVSVTL